MNIIRELFYGNVSSDPFIAKRRPEYTDAIRTASETEEQLEKCLNTEEQELLSRLIKSYDDILDIECCERFYDGWKMGVKFVIDTFVIS